MCYAKAPLQLAPRKYRLQQAFLMTEFGNHWGSFSMQAWWKDLPMGSTSCTGRKADFLVPR